MAKPQRCRYKGNLRNRNERRSIPPRHRNGVFIPGFLKMIRVVRAKDTMVDQGVPLERVGKPANRFMHDEPMQRPLKKRTEDRARGEPSHQPQEKTRRYHLLFVPIVYCPMCNLLPSEKLSQPIRDSSLRQIVRRHFQTHAIAYGQSHEMLPHFT